MPKVRRDARVLKDKALASLRRAMDAFNSHVEDGRTTAVLLHLQHSAEMLLKAALFQKRFAVFDKRAGTSIGFEKCVKVASQAHACGLSASEQGALRAIDAMRDAEQHWILSISEPLLYLHSRALITAFDDILKRTFSESLADHLPGRVLPVSTEPPQAFDLLIDSEFSQIRGLLRPGKRQREEARARIRTLLAMEAHVSEEITISETDVDRIEDAVRNGKELTDSFPRLTTLQTTQEGTGFTATVRFSRKEGAPVRFVSGDDPEEAAAVREVDLSKKYHCTRSQLATAVGLSVGRAKTLRDELGLDDDPRCIHVFRHGNQSVPCYSDTAIESLRKAANERDLDEIWQRRRPAGRRKR